MDDEEKRYVDNDLEQTQQNIVNTTADVAKSGKDTISDLNNKRKERKNEKERKILGDDTEKKKFVGPDKKVKGIYYAKKGELDQALGRARQARGRAKHAIGTSQRATAAAIKGASTLLGLIPYVGPAIKASLDSTAKTINDRGKKNQKSGKDTIKSGKDKVKEGKYNQKRGLKLRNTGKDIGDYKSKSGKISSGANTNIPNAGSIISGVKRSKKMSFKGFIGAFLGPKKFILIAAIVFLLLSSFILLFLIKSEENEGSYKEGDEKNVPYVVTSQALNSIKVVPNESGDGVSFGYVDENGNQLGLDETIDKILDTLEKNDSNALGDLGETDEERKEFLKLLIQSEIATQYPDLGNNTGYTTKKTDSGEIKIPNELKGNIKINRKDESGNVVQLKYVDEDTFNDMIASRNAEVMNCYTLKKNTMTSGSGTYNSNVTLSGDEAKEQIFNFLVDSGATPEGAAGLMGNLQAESACKSVRVQGDYNYSNPDEYSLNYTTQVDNGTISEENFVYNGPGGGGYGLAQWTATNRKQNLYNYAKSKGKSIGDLQTQLEFLVQELQTGYSSIWNLMTTSTDMKAVSNKVLHSFEKPADQSSTVENLRYSNGKAIYDLYASKRNSTNSSNTSSTTKNENSTKSDDNSKNGKSNSSTNNNKSSTKVSSLDNFLFIGDSRYNGISSQLSSLGKNITVIGVDNSKSDEWATVTKGGSGSVQGQSVTLPSSAKGVSVMIGVNSLNQTEETKQMLENLHAKYPSATIYYNSIYHVAGNYNVSGITAINMNANIDLFNNTMIEYCKDKSWVEYVNITDNLNDENGLLKNADSMGLHITDEGKSTLVDNIKNEILGKLGNSSSNTNPDSQTVNSSSSQYTLLVASETTRHLISIDSYEYSYTTMISTSSGTKGPGTQKRATPENSVSEEYTTTDYSITNLDYQAALRDYTVHFDFLWAMFVSTRDKNFVSEWANEALNSKIDITIFSQEQTVQDISSNELQPRYLHSIEGTTAYEDCFNVKRTTTTTTTTKTSKAGVTNADVWMLKYQNNPSTYAEYVAKSSEVVEEKFGADSGIMKLLNDKDRLKNLNTRYYLVERMIKNNEKVSFMTDIYKYVLEKAGGKKTEGNGVLDIIDVGSFDIKKFSRASGGASGEGSIGGEEIEESGDGYNNIFVVGTRTYKNYKQQQGSYCQDELAGFSGDTLYRSGCAINAVAVLASGYGIDMNPGEVNAYAKTTSSPTAHQNTLSSLIGKETSIHSAGDLSQIIIEQLKAGRPCIARTRYYSFSHYIGILAISEDGNQVYVSDTGGEYPGRGRDGWQPISFLQRIDWEVITIDE